jgi:Ca2+-binding RTX toxin-like protein
MKLPRLILVVLAFVALAAAAPAQAKIRSSFANGILTATGGKKNDRIRVACAADGLAKVNGRDPRGGPVSCSAVSEVDAVTRAGNDRVNLSGVDGRFGVRDFPGFGTGTGGAAALGPGNDRYVGSATAFNLVLGGGGNDFGRGGASRDSMQGGDGNDVFTSLGGNDVLVGQAGDDRLSGGPGDDLLSGSSGDDRLNGGAGADLLAGGLGMDRLSGGPGDDELMGGPQKDRLNGGGGKNKVVQGGK